MEAFRNLSIELYRRVTEHFWVHSNSDRRLTMRWNCKRADCGQEQMDWRYIGTALGNSIYYFEYRVIANKSVKVSSVFVQLTDSEKKQETNFVFASYSYCATEFE